MPIYCYKHPKTGEIFEVIRPMKDSDEPYIAPDGIKCERIISQFSGGKGNKEVFEADPAYVKRMNPKYVKFQDGHKERYDSSKHC